jgi:serine acetyltransferase
VIANYMFKHKSRFGAYAIMDSCICEANIIGDYSTVGPFVNITTASIGNSVYIKTHAAVIPGRIIGDNVTINPGSIVMSNLKNGVHVAGVPASRNLKKWEAMKK